MKVAGNGIIGHFLHGRNIDNKIEFMVQQEFLAPGRAIQKIIIATFGVLLGKPVTAV